MTGHHDEVVFVGEGDRRTAPLHLERVGVAVDADQLHRLQPTTVRRTGLEPHRLELRRDVLLRELITPRGRTTPLEQIGGEEPHVPPQLRGVDRLHRRGRRQQQERQHHAAIFQVVPVGESIMSTPIVFASARRRSDSA